MFSLFSSFAWILAAITSPQGVISSTMLARANLFSTNAPQIETACTDAVFAERVNTDKTSTIVSFVPDGEEFKVEDILQDYSWIQIGQILDITADPNGCRIVFSWQDKSGGSDLWEVRSDGKELRRLTFSQRRERNPTRLENGSIVFSVQRREKDGPIKNVLVTMNRQGKISDFGFDGIAVVVLPSGFIIESEQHDLIFHDLPTGFSTKIAEGSNLHRLPGNDYSITYTENDQIFMINGFFPPLPVFIAFGEYFAPDPRRNEVAGIVAYNGQLFRYKNGQAVRMTHGPASYNHPVLAVAGGK